MATFRSPPHGSDPFTTMPDGKVIVNQDWFGWFVEVADMLTRGKSVVVPLAKITGGGTDGSLTFVNGLLVNTVAPT